MKEITANEFDQEVLKGEKVVVDFYSTECPPCEALFPKYEAVAELYGHKIKFLKIYRQEQRARHSTRRFLVSHTFIF